MDKPEYKLKEKTWIIANENNVFEDRKSSQGHSIKVYIHGEKITGGTFVIPPKAKLGRISAHPSDETYYVLKGKMKVDLPRLGKVIDLDTGDLFYMPGGMIHAPFNDTDEECLILWHCAPDWP